MLPFFATFLFAYSIYLLLTAGSGPLLGLWSSDEFALGLAVAAVVAWASRGFFCDPARRAALQPVRWLRAIAYVFGPFFVEMAKANVDVACRVLTGRIRPGIVRVRSGMQSDLGVLMLSNSITLTPGTLTVGVDEETNDLFVHMINVPEGTENREFLEAREVFSIYDCPSWIRRIAE